MSHGRVVEERRWQTTAQDDGNFDPTQWYDMSRTVRLRGEG